MIQDYFSLKLYHWLYDLIFNKLTLETKLSGGTFFRVPHSRRRLEKLCLPGVPGKSLPSGCGWQNGATPIPPKAPWKVSRTCLNLENPTASLNVTSLGSEERKRKAYPRITLVTSVLFQNDVTLKLSPAGEQWWFCADLQDERKQEKAFDHAG